MQPIYVAIIMAIVMVFTSCQKELKPPIGETENLATTKAAIVLPKTTNPFSLRNIQKAKATIAANSNITNIASTANPTDIEPQFIYFKFNPNELSEGQMQNLQTDTSVFMLQIPFANMALYTEEFALDSTKVEQLKDGYIYGIAPASNTNLISQLTSRTATQTTLLDTLVKVAEEDTALQFQAFREIGYTETQLGKFRICQFKRPHGYVRYQDNDLGQGHLEPVKGIGVWTLVFGIPIMSFTDDNGFYNTPWRFSFGTIIGTYASNDKVDVRPINTRTVASLIAEFIIGSRYVHDWITPCEMRDDININFVGHTKERYWSLILNGYNLDHQYCDFFNIKTPPKLMRCYAQWANGNEFGNASTPLLNHISANPNFIKIFTKWWGAGNAAITTYFTLLMTNLLPDNTYSVGGGGEPVHYTSQLTQTIFHELGHASHFKQVGNTWYTKMALAEMQITDPGYGNADYEDWGKVQVAESWAEFIGTQFARRKYGNNGFKHFTNITGVSSFSLFNIDQERVFTENWIPTGFYYDLMDETNSFTNENLDDAIGGSTIHNMYYVFNNNTNDMCTYQWQFLNTYPNFNTLAYTNLINFHNVNCQ